MLEKIALGLYLSNIILIIILVSIIRNYRDKIKIKDDLLNAYKVCFDEDREIIKDLRKRL
jgi:hypothetical protein